MSEMGLAFILSRYWARRHRSVSVGRSSAIRSLDIDLGFAYLPEYLGKGYALEAAQATLDYVKLKLAVSRIVAITMAENVRSIRLLKKLGFRYEKDARLLSATSHPVQVYGLEL